MIKADIPFQFDFWYNMYGSGMGGISLKTYDGGSVVWTKSGNLGDKWRLASVSIPAGTVQLRFEAVTGPTWASDFALDDFSVKVVKVTTTTTTTNLEATTFPALQTSGMHCSNHINLRVAGLWTSGGSVADCGALAASAGAVSGGCEGIYFHFRDNYGDGNSDCGCATDSCVARTSDSNWRIYMNMQGAASR